MKKNKNKQKHYALLFVLFTALLIISCQYTLTARTIETVSASSYQNPDELSVKEYVLNEVRKAGIDEFKVWALINCESRWSPSAYFVNIDKSVDRGLFMFNDHFQKQVTNDCAWDYKCSTREAIKLIKKQGFKPWVCSKQLGL